MHPGYGVYDNKQFMIKRHDGKRADVIIVDEPVELDMEGEFTYGNAKVLRGESTVFSLPLTHKEWYKKRKGKRWVWYCVTKPGLDLRNWDGLFNYGSTNRKFGFSKKKRRGKRAKEFMRYIGFCREWMKTNYVDYSAYTKDCEEVEMKYPGDDTVYKYKVLKPEDNTKFEAIVTKRIDEIKERK